MAIDYELAKKLRPKQKAALTRAVNAKKKGGDYYWQVLSVCKQAVREWEQMGAWPDDWSRWQRALDDATFDHNRHYGIEYVRMKRLEELR